MIFDKEPIIQIKTTPQAECGSPTTEGKDEFGVVRKKKTVKAKAQEVQRPPQKVKMPINKIAHSKKKKNAHGIAKRPSEAITRPGRRIIHPQ